MKKIVLLLRSGDFLTRARMTLWAAGLVLGYVLCGVFLGLTAHGLNDYTGRPLGTDFSNVYAAGVAALHGDATAPFDILRQQQTEQAIFGAATQLYGWHYPPFFLLVAAALARLPYIPALILWQAATLMLYLGSVWLLLRKSAAPFLSQDRLWPLLALGFTAVFVNVTHGQNGFLTAALFASGLALLDERPVVAGVLFGLLCYKPQFAVVIPLVLAATGHWRTFGAAAATVLAAGGAVTMIFGAEIWPAFMASAHFTRTVVLEQGNTGFYKMQSVFAGIRMWGGGVTLAYGAQAIAAVTVLYGLVRIWRGNIAIGYKGAALCLAALLVTPYSMDYDLMLLAPAIVLLIAEGTARGFKNYERLLLTVLWVVPAIVRNVAHYTIIPLAIPAMVFCLGSIYLRCGARGLSAASGPQPMGMMP
ncbi:MAG TPA: glycosyltransferase family 87 protein [Rhizomicrobium sp.]|nr:glycosyltransferase family 87 protein [Rhizomicrobium sp.]